MLERYRYVIEKYGTDHYAYFIGRGIAKKALNFNPLRAGTDPSLRVLTFSLASLSLAGIGFFLYKRGSKKKPSSLN